MRKVGFLALFLGSCFMLFGQEVITDFTADEGSPIIREGDFLIQGNVLVKYIGNGGPVAIPADLEVTEIGDNAFGYTPVESVAVSQGITKIGAYAFTNCQELTGLTIPDSVTSIGDGAFSGCPQLTNITVHTNNRAYASEDGVLFNKTGTVLIAYPVGKENPEYVVPDGVIRIEQNAFSNSSHLAEITFPKGLITIGDKAFYNCKGLTAVTLPSSLTDIEDRAFYRCSNLTALTVPAGLKRIGSYAFDGCTSLVTMQLSRSTEYGTHSFRKVPGNFPYTD